MKPLNITDSRTAEEDDAQIESLEAQLAQAEEFAREANEKNLALVNENLVLKALLRAWEKEHGRDT